MGRGKDTDLPVSWAACLCASLFHKANNTHRPQYFGYLFLTYKIAKCSNGP